MSEAFLEVLYGIEHQIKRVADRLGCSVGDGEQKPYPLEAIARALGAGTPDDEAFISLSSIGYKLTEIADTLGGAPYPPVTEEEIEENEKQ